MAPRSPLKRVTRARAAATSSSTDNMDAPPRKMPAARVTKSASTTKPKPTTRTEADIAKPAEMAAVATGEATKPAARKSRSGEDDTKPATRNTRSTTAPLAAAPRRRIKVTPLDVPSPQEAPIVEEAKEAAKPKKTKRTATKSSNDESEKAPRDTIEVESTVPKTRSKRKTVDEKKKDDVADPPAKTRGRPKKHVNLDEEQSQEPTKSTRQTRTRAGSNAVASQPTVASLAKASALPKKKVTFQVDDEDDKENNPIATKKSTTKKAASATTTGMRARPIRKPAAASTKTKTITKSKQHTEDPAPKPLSPKKITQVNRSTTPVESDDEDVLNGGKTPVRDLSQSPKRNAVLGARLSPVKRLDFDTVLGGAMADTLKAPMMSPPRRPPPSPARGDDVFAVPVLAIGPESQPTLLQSPKRGNINATIFSQSAIVAAKSPLKTSLFGSPAKRLFSPSKKPSEKPAIPLLDGNTSPDVMVSSHFRSSVSPQRSARVHRLTDEEIAQELGMDFDDSVMNVRSPLKVYQPAKFEEVLASESKTEEDQTDETSADDGMDVMEVLQESEGALIGEQDKEVELRNEASSIDEHMSDVQDNAEFDNTVILHSTKSEVTPAGMDIEDEIAQGQSDSNEMAHPSTAEDFVEPEKLQLSEASESETRVVKTSARSRPSISGHLFSDRRLRDDDESSEDELATDQTPQQAIRGFRSSLTGRQSMVNTGGIGFTPLAAQMSGWLASSPEKQQKQPSQRGTFSPVAAQHVDGEVVISRQSTPAGKVSVARTPLNTRQSLGLRKSLAARSSLAPSTLGSPEKISFFTEAMAETQHDDQDESQDPLQGYVDMQMDADNLLEDAVEDGLPEELTEDSHEIDPDETELEKDQSPGELTTDLINFTHATETAMVDFAALAQEADELAPEEERSESTEPFMELLVEKMPPTVPETKQPSSENSVYGDENANPAETPSRASQVDVEVVEQQPGRDATVRAQSSPVRLTDAESQAAVSEDTHDSKASTVLLSIDVVTPVRASIDSKQYPNTVVSKIPLRPEGAMSPIKVTKKRSRSLSAGPQSASKRRSSPEAVLFLPIDSVENLTPGRGARSTAPSPAKSLISNVTTPGQMSFTVDDFGDSTLDGLEIDVDMTQDIEEAQDESMVSLPHSMFATPATVKVAKSLQSTPARTPLKAVGNGVLHGAIVFVDVHTSEGADARDVFIELLTEMGAKCVKEWRWNPRSSIASGVEDTKAAIGITHVVYKDGGKRTLEKVRDAAGEVCCVGVSWVLDCESEKKWLEETPYLIDTSILPRGGSRRRKSMEPRMLIHQNGNVLPARRSVSGEMTEQMKQDLVNTSVRGRDSIASAITAGMLSEMDGSEISSTYNSPTTTMNFNVSGYEQDNEVMQRFLAPTPGKSTHRGDADDDEEEEGGMATPTALIGWDPATSQTPITPKLVKKGEGKVMSAPPKRTAMEQDDSKVFEDNGKANNDGGKMKLKMGDARRRTLGADLGKWKPRIGSPLAK